MADLLDTETALNVLATAFLAVGIALALASFYPRARSHSTRLSAVFLVVGLCLLSNSAWVYFASIFIIATAVTDLEFLHTLAAIIRGSEHYFRYRTELLSREESLRKIQREQTDDDDTGREPKQWPPNVGQLGYLIEQLTTERLEKDLQSRIERAVRFVKGRRVIEVDGIARGDRLGRDQIIEVKWLRRGGLTRLIEQTHAFLRLVAEYREITGRDAYLVLAVVVPQRSLMVEDERVTLESQLRSTRDNWSLYVYTYQDIGLPEQPAAS